MHSWFYVEEIAIEIIMINIREIFTLNLFINYYNYDVKKNMKVYIKFCKIKNIDLLKNKYTLKINKKNFYF